MHRLMTCKSSSHPYTHPTFVLHSRIQYFKGASCNAYDVIESVSSADNDSKSPFFKRTPYAISTITISSFKSLQACFLNRKFAAISPEKLTSQLLSDAPCPVLKSNSSCKHFWGLTKCIMTQGDANMKWCVSEIIRYKCGEVDRDIE